MMNNSLIVSVVAAAIAGLVVGPVAQPAVINSVPDIGWSTLFVMFVIGALVPPGALLALATGEHYVAMARAWSAFFFLGVFLVAAGAAALVFCDGPRRADPAAYLFLAWGSGALVILGLLKLRLLRLSAKKAAAGAASSAESIESSEV